MRKISFRVWDKGRKEWVHGPGDEVNLFGECILLGEFLRRDSDDTHVSLDDLNDMVALQFTGLKYKGVDIYEGDIFNRKRNKASPAGGYIAGTYAYHPETAQVVEWHNGGFLVGHEPIASFLSFILHAGHEQDLIGNIYSNPELLK